MERSSSLTPKRLDALRLSAMSAQAICGILPFVPVDDQSELFLGISGPSVLNKDEAAAIMMFASKHLASLDPSSMEVKITDGNYVLGNSDQNWCIVLSLMEEGSVEDLVRVVNDHLTKAAPGLHNVEAKL
ncbi:hypothetical protein FRB99_001764 [Tulasnella sp. 403]|nr:hypothetical protein FRB99_001764 [Tulasnella sp. 403]